MRIADHSVTRAILERHGLTVWCDFNGNFNFDKKL